MHGNDLSDETTIKDIPWSELKHKLFEPEFNQKEFFSTLSNDE